MWDMEGNKMTKYKCVERLVVGETEYPDGPHTGGEFSVEVGSVWEVSQEYPPTKYGVYYELFDENGSWLNIWGDTLENHFEKVED